MATFRLSSAASLNLGWSQNGVSGNGLNNKINVVEIKISIFDGTENIVEKGENVGYKHFLLFPQCF